jgi:hypothetical protein
LGREIIMPYFTYEKQVSFSTLHGKVLVKIEGNVNDGKMVFTTSKGEIYTLFHDQDCCEHVYIQDIAGDLKDILYTPILLAEESSSRKDPPDCPFPAPKPYDEDDENWEDDWRESFTWTFYKLSTIKGSVTIRWYGQSNGYYSERCTFIKGKISDLWDHEED